MTEVVSKAPSVQPGPLPPGVKDTQPSLTGLFLASDSSRTSILNGSHKTLCHENDHETVLVFPDFKVVTEVRRSTQGAQELWDSAVNPSIGRSGAYLKNELKTWIIPYSCVILLCYFLPLFFTQSDRGWSTGSHKKRDNRCGIAAPKLEHGELISVIPCIVVLMFFIVGFLSVYKIIRNARLGCRHTIRASFSLYGRTARGSRRNSREERRKYFFSAQRNR